MAAEEEEVVVPVNLAEPLMDFSNIGKTVDGTGFAYRSLECIKKQIGPIKGIEMYSHLQHIDFSNNVIKDVTPLKLLKFVLKLNLARNEINSIKPLMPAEGEEPTFPYLLHLDVSANQLTSLPVLSTMPALRTASFAKNAITTAEEFTGHPTLETLDISENQIPKLAGVAAMPLLTKLNASSNELEDINGLAELPALEELNLAKNKFQALEGPWAELTKLTAVNVSGGLLPSPKPLEVLRQAPNLRNLEVAGNTFTEEDGCNVRIEVLVCHWRLKVIDGEPVTEEELEEAKELNLKRLEEERARKQAEEEAAAAGGGEDAG